MGTIERGRLTTGSPWQISGMTAPAADPLLDALGRLRQAVAEVTLPLELAGSEAGRRERSAVAGQIDDYLLPRLRQLDAPLLMVVGGSTGAGKSTLVNSLMGTQVTTAGVLRPTTRSPVLACSPADVRWFADDRVLPGMARTTGETGDPGDARTLRLVPTDALAPGLAVLDAPDIDSVVAANRELAAQLLAAADLWLFVTTAARYADAVPWDLLHTAASRSTALAVVLNRVPPEARHDVRTHLQEMLQANKLGGTALFQVQETALEAEMLPAEEVAPIRAWLTELAADADRRAEVIRSTLTGALAALSGRVPPLADAADAQHRAFDRLRSVVDGAYDVAAREVEDGIRDGSLLRGEVLARWQEFVGTGEFMRTLESRIGEFRDRLWAAVRGRPQPGAPVRAALESSIEDLVLDAADRAAERVVASWQAEPGGADLLSPELNRALSRSSARLRAELATDIRAWQGYVLDLVSEEGADKRTAARFASLGVNGAGLAVMLGVFAHTGGLTGGEVAIAGGTTVAGQRVLEAVFGDQAVRTLAYQARTDLMDRVRRLLADEAARFEGPLSRAGVIDGSALRAALASVQQAQRAGGTA